MSAFDDFKPGDTVRYTATAVRLMQPPSKDVRGAVVEIEHEHAVLVRWPMGLSSEYPQHIRKVAGGATDERGQVEGEQNG